MGSIREVFDVKQHPMRNGELSTLEERVQSIERRFAKIYRQEQVDRFSGFCTENGTRFFVNGIYEWQTVFLEYDDGEDGDMLSLDHDEETMFNELHQEILVCELDEQMRSEKTYRIYKTEREGGKTSVSFRFWAGRAELSQLFSQHSAVEIDGCKYGFVGDAEHQRVTIDRNFEEDLYDHWLKFVV